jgi:hypothetical protein
MSIPESPNRLFDLPLELFNPILELVVPLDYDESSRGRRLLLSLRLVCGTFTNRVKRFTDTNLPLSLFRHIFHREVYA